MGGLTGYINFADNFIREKERHIANTEAMAEKINCPGSVGVWIGEHIALGNGNESQLIERVVSGYQFVITYDGEIYNKKELRDDILKYGYCFTTMTDAETVLYSYIHYGADCVNRINGVYSFCIWDTMRQKVFLCRDRLGIMRLFYSVSGENIFFASRQKCISAFPGNHAEISAQSLKKLLSFKDGYKTALLEKISELPAGAYMIADRNGLHIKKYFEPTAVRYDKDIVIENIKLAPKSAVIMSDNEESPVISSVLRKTGSDFHTYSFNFGEKETDGYISCEMEKLIDCVYKSVDINDFPICDFEEAALLHFYRQIGERESSVLCAASSKHKFSYNCDIFPDEIKNDISDDSKPDIFGYVRANISAASIYGVNVRFPFCDYRIFCDLTKPVNIKNDYAADFDLKLSQMLLDIISNRNEPLLAFCDYDKLVKLCRLDIENYDNFSERSRIIGYLLQINEWFKKFRVKIV